VTATLETAAAAPTSLRGVAPLTARAEPWQLRLLERPGLLQDLVAEHGSPLNLIDPAPMGRNLADLRAAARVHGLELGIYFARKANKALGLVDRALELGAGVDVASEQELRQALDRDVPAERIVVTAAVKPRGLLELCARAGALVAIDNADELAVARSVADDAGVRLPVAVRLAVSGSDPARPPTRFGIDPPDVPALLGSGALGGDGDGPGLRLRGLHFHLDGYDPGDRVAALRTAIALADELASTGAEIGFVDMGGGIPMRYLDDEEEWLAFWAEMRASLTGERPPLTYLRHGLGLHVAGGTVEGAPAVYPAAQRLIGPDWLQRVLGAPAAEGEGPASATVAAALSSRGLELRCEPGRALLDGCGMTLARVEFRKRGAAGDRLVGLAMNRTQCRTAAEDSMLDPWLVRGPRSGEPSEPFEGYLVGAYCIERELITWRRMSFGEGAAVGDLLVFPNTAGYFMHILESSSHQMPLARNLLLAGGEPAGLDPIDR
jgi:diaminopimelate decarboxylase